MRFLIMILLLYPITGYTADYHPADTNKDWQISLEEFNAYNTAWRQGNEWPDSVNPIPNTYVARGGYLYKKGNCYNKNNGNAPMSWDSDKDCDGTVDAVDQCPDDPNTSDRDNDKTLDCLDQCPDDSNKTKPGICGCGKADTGDRDNDKTLDCVDQCPDDPNKTKPGICGCGKDEDCQYLDNQDHTVTARGTCLMWQKETASSSMNWNDAQNYCNNLKLAGYSDWRLPTHAELMSIVDNNFRKPTINTDYFPNTKSDWYWSSTSASNTAARGVTFYDGWGGNSGNPKSGKYYVRAVRGEQCR